MLASIQASPKPYKRLGTSVSLHRGFFFASCCLLLVVESCSSESCQSPPPWLQSPGWPSYPARSVVVACCNRNRARLPSGQRLRRALTVVSVSRSVLRRLSENDVDAFSGFWTKRETMSSATRKVILKASDDVVFEIDEAVAFQSVVIKFAIEDCHDNYIRLPNVTSKILEKVIDYCKRHLEAEESPYQQARDDLEAFDAEFVKVDQATLFDLIQDLHLYVWTVACNYGSKLSKHQELVGPDLRCSWGHDQGKNLSRNIKNIQH
ncbi:uncharacterized protein LOC127807413 isoform X4 [Diospyros lotus]|uniref:uncharacterized protein LOC127807413 isoform X4 n=1 Tax=Diospyros lotus TaxID=55363 RepID=UPI002256C644|nr:uncharacterized protein LOC127807413 isoform X4 [Diospyros lotus]